MTSSTALLTTENLSKRYVADAALALDSVTLRVAAGEVYGFLGANGAGKSTIIRTLLGFLKPTSGKASICDLDIVKDTVEVKRHVGYLSGDVALYPKVTGNELFAYLSKLQQKDTTAYLKELVQRFEAEPEKQIAELSKGNRQKIGVIQALMHQPDVLILDEPTSGLDPLMQEVFYKTIREASKRGAAVFVSSHNLTETQRMCDRIGIIKHGKLIREQSIKDDVLLGAPVFRIALSNAKQAEALHTNTALKVVSVQGSTVAVQPSGTIADALKALSLCDIKSFATEQINLEDEFLEYYGDGA
jgi:ABC-2 type transport system ATP-binding protein